ncbi:MAG TPA: class I SAM-dependent methyltransferase [Thermoflexia bacterium]|jgi:ubiquinone/menaquinone biosynthesis C-methylase UbiE|nr:class I SAM-dependent methyltransferase [Thermoflexia bacterium]
MTWALVVGGVLLLAGLLYWQLVIAEGTYLGPRVVTFLYNLVAPTYDEIKQFDMACEQWFLGLPLARALETVPAPLVLDVGTGTGRLPRALLFQPAFQGRVIGLDLSRRMLTEAARRLRPYGEQVSLIWQDAQVLPFPDDTFDAVTCLEVLEFTPRPRAVLRELVRVLRPGGVLLISNRIGRDAALLPGRAFPRPVLEQVLENLLLEDIQIRPWQEDYDLVWALKRGEPRGGGVRPLEEILRCPACQHGPLSLEREAYRCAGCGREYPVAKDGVIEMAAAARRRPR